nr:uncharacterized protein LOC129284137 [Lytechinus pictus]
MAELKMAKVVVPTVLILVGVLLVRGFPSLPKFLTFDGRGSWQSFLCKFQLYSETNGWDQAQERNQFCYCLEGSASEFLALVLGREQSITYTNLIKKFEQRFVSQETPKDELIFNSSKQATTESEIDWARCVLSLAARAFEGQPEEIVGKKIIYKFCQGSLDHEAGQYALNSHPQTLEEAIYRVQLFQCKQKYARQMPYDTVEEDPRINRMGVSGRASNAQLPSRLDRLEDRLSSIEKKVDNLQSLETQMKSLQSTVQALVTAVQELNEPTRSPSTEDTESKVSCRDVCFACNKSGHFKRNCPERLAITHVDILSVDEVTVNTTCVDDVTVHTTCVSDDTVNNIGVDNASLVTVSEDSRASTEDAKYGQSYLVQLLLGITPPKFSILEFLSSFLWWNQRYVCSLGNNPFLTSCPWLLPPWPPPQEWSNISLISC